MHAVHYNVFVSLKATIFAELKVTVAGKAYILPIFCQEIKIRYVFLIIVDTVFDFSSHEQSNVVWSVSGRWYQVATPGARCTLQCSCELRSDGHWTCESDSGGKNVLQSFSWWPLTASQFFQQKPGLLSVLNRFHVSLGLKVGVCLVFTCNVIPILEFWKPSKLLFANLLASFYFNFSTQLRFPINKSSFLISLPVYLWLSMFSSPQWRWQRFVFACALLFISFFICCAYSLQFRCLKSRYPLPAKLVCEVKVSQTRTGTDKSIMHCLWQSKSFI